jgi:NACalpha-BTF3-like transcription factor
MESDKYVGRSAQLGTINSNDINKMNDINNEYIIKLVVDHTQCRRSRAINALHDSNYDVVTAIMSIQDISDI